MKYKVIALMSGSSLDGIDLVYTEITEKAGTFNYQIIHSKCVPYEASMQLKLKNATELTASNFLKFNVEYGIFLGNIILHFIQKNSLHYKIDFVVSHGHTIFHSPEQGFTTQIGCGANIASILKIPVIDNLRTMDVAHKGQGAPIVPIGDKYFFNEYTFLLNIGGISNITFQNEKQHCAFDIAPANSVLNFLSNKLNFEYDNKGNLGKNGKVNSDLLKDLQQIDYFKQAYPKSLSNQFLTEKILPVLNKFNLPLQDLLTTYYEFLSLEIYHSINFLYQNKQIINAKILITGGGAFNDFLISLIKNKLQKFNIECVIPDAETVKFKEALIMALIGVLRWRLEVNVLKTITGATHNNVNGAIWFASELEN